jgi:hypothetical protein
MAHGAERCMYCLDNYGTDIDHFQPIAVAPLRAFDWPNHLLACSRCNSNFKRDEYPCDADGNCLLVDPSAEDPADHLLLLPSSGHYDALTPKGAATIRVFGLNRPDLVQGRRTAFVMTCAILRDWHAHGSAETAEALRQSPHADVLRSLERLDPGVAAQLLGGPAAEALARWRGVYAV